jgi:hypothetical protein
MSESKFLLYGQFHRANGWIMNDCLGYIKETKEDAIAVYMLELFPGTS